MAYTGLTPGYIPGTDQDGWRYGETGEQLFMGFAAPRAVVAGSAVYEGGRTANLQCPQIQTFDLAGAGFVSKNRTNLRAHLQSSTVYHCKFFSPDTTLQLIMLIPPGHVKQGTGPPATPFFPSPFPPPAQGTPSDALVLVLGVGDGWGVLGNTPSSGPPSRAIHLPPLRSAHSDSASRNADSAS